MYVEMYVEIGLIKPFQLTTCMHIETGNHPYLTYMQGEGSSKYGVVAIVGID